jgi:hypothetical protein
LLVFQFLLVTEWLLLLYSCQVFACHLQVVLLSEGAELLPEVSAERHAGDEIEQLVWVLADPVGDVLQ